MSDSALQNLGPRLRAARQSRELTLAELSERASISASTLSRLEAGKRQATLELLLPITRVLDIRIDDLIDHATPDPRVRRASVTRDGLTITPLSPRGSAIDTYRVSYPPTAVPPELRVHDGYEWLYVLDGTLRLRLGEQDLLLNPGEAAEFDTQVPHAMSAHGTTPAHIISIFNASGARIHTHLGEETQEGRTSASDIT